MLGPKTNKDVSCETKSVVNSKSVCPNEASQSRVFEKQIQIYVGKVEKWKQMRVACLFEGSCA